MDKQDFLAKREEELRRLNEQVEEKNRDIIYDLERSGQEAELYNFIPQNQNEEVEEEAGAGEEEGEQQEEFEDPPDYALPSIQDPKDEPPKIKSRKEKKGDELAPV